MCGCSSAASSEDVRRLISQVRPRARTAIQSHALHLPLFAHFSFQLSSTIDSRLLENRCRNKILLKRRTATATSRATMVQWSPRDSTVKLAQNKCDLLFERWIQICDVSFVRVQHQQDERDSYENDDQDDEDAGPSTRSSGLVHPWFCPAFQITIYVHFVVAVLTSSIAGLISPPLVICWTKTTHNKNSFTA